jgi:hypothetical protein
MKTRASSFLRVKRVLSILRATLSEVFEESAYTRFLQRRGLKTSRESYALFLRETEASRGRKVRCC